MKEPSKISLAELLSYNMREIARVFNFYSGGPHLGAVIQAVKVLNVEGHNIILTFPDGHDYHKQKVENNRKIIEKIFGKWVGEPVKVYGNWEHRETEVPRQDPRVIDSKDRLSHLQQQIQRRREDLTQLVGKVENARAENARLETQLKQRNIELAKLIAKIESTQAQKAPLETQIQQTSSELLQLKVNVKAVEAQKAQAETRISQLRKQQTSLLSKNKRVEEQRSELQTQLEDLKSQINRVEQQLADVMSGLEPREVELQDTQQKINQAKAILSTLQAQIYQPLWQAALRASLDAAILPPHIDWVLAALEESVPDVTRAFQLEIAARTGQTSMPQVADSSDGTTSLFAGVIQARHAAQSGELLTATEHLCGGWEAFLSAIPEPVSILTPAMPKPESTSLPASETEIVPVMPTMKPVPQSKALQVSGAWSTLTLEFEDRVIVIDPGGKDYSLPEEAPDMVIISHAHFDHVRHLPALAQRFPGVPIIMTPETRQLLILSANSGWAMDNWQITETPFNSPLHTADLEIVLHPAGHLLGAAMIELLSATHILITGDFSLRPVGGVPAAKLELFQRKYDLLLMEAVHACDATFPTQSLQHDRQTYLIERLAQAITVGYHRIFIFAAALGDAQEVYHALWEDQHTAPNSALQGFTIYLKGLAYQVAQCYVQAGIWQGIVFEEPVDFPAQSIIICREADAHALRRQIEQTQHGVVFEPYKSAKSALSSEQDRRYQVDLHASLPALQSVGQSVQCDIVGLYHSQTANSPLEKVLAAAGKTCVNVSSADHQLLELK